LDLAMTEIDLARDKTHDLREVKRCEGFVEQVRQGRWEVVFVTPPCNTFSRANWSWRPGPRPCRSKQWPRGCPWASTKDKQRAEDGNHFVDFTKAVVEAAASCSSHEVLFLVEHPEDLGRTPTGDPASIWQDAGLMKFIGGNALTIALHQCVLGVDYPKPTRLLTNITELAAWGFVGPPCFDHDNLYLGPLPKDCGHHHPPRPWKSSDGSYATAATAAYPDKMCEALATSVIAAVQRIKPQQPPLVAPSVGGGGQQPEQQPEQRRGQPGQKSRHRSKSAPSTTPARR
jgi:hypothetical protein